MDDYFRKLMQEKHNSVDMCVMWFQNSKLIDASKEAEERVRVLFADVKDKQNVDLDKFKEAVYKLAEGQKTTFEEFKKMLCEQGPRFLEAIMAGASAFKNAITKK